MRNGTTRRHALKLALAAPAVLIAGRARADYPDGAITLVVPFAPGGASDLIARLLGGPLAEALGQNVVVKNRAGANGNIGIADVARARPDGYTLLVASSVLTVNPSLYSDVTYNPIKDFTPLVDIGASPNAIVTQPGNGIQTVADLVAAARRRPGGLNFASPGTGSISQLAVELLKVREHIDLTHVPYAGAGPAVVAVLGGQVQLAAVNISAVLGDIKAGTLHAIVQTGQSRWPELPDVPTMQEAGIPNASSETDQALLGPAGLPGPVIARLTGATLAILARPDIRTRIMQAGLGVIAGGPDRLRARINREVPMWRDVIEAAHLKIG
jgi:tripartite-type tricarboxylate transporter receptor subunit TctC